MNDLFDKAKDKTVELAGKAGDSIKDLVEKVKGDKDDGAADAGAQ